MAQSVQQPILDFGSGHDLTGCGTEPHMLGSALGVEPAWDSQSLFAPPPLVLSKIKI